MTLADAYCALARSAIGMAVTAQQLRNWWRDETLRRHQYGLTPEQEVDLANQCQLRIRSFTAAGS
jgi:hypothetical protein